METGYFASPIDSEDEGKKVDKVEKQKKKEQIAKKEEKDVSFDGTSKEKEPVKPHLDAMDDSHYKQFKQLQLVKERPKLSNHLLFLSHLSSYQVQSG